MALADPEAIGRRVLLRVSQIRLANVTDPVGAIHVGIAAEKAGDFDLGARFLGRAVDRLREQGRLGLLTQALVHYAWAATLRVTGPPPPRRVLSVRGWPGTPISRSMGSRVS